VNFGDYLDTGLFLDHRSVRGMLRTWARDADFLNLFCYTGSATVYAAAGGARSSVSVDLSNTYLEWAHENLVLNGLAGPGVARPGVARPGVAPPSVARPGVAPPNHELCRADCRKWLEEESARGPRFDLIFLDPPTFSNSKRMQGVLDVQRDHAVMIRHAMQLLRPPGRLVFSTNYSRFKLDAGALGDFEIEDISARTIPKDFARHARIHRCYVVRHRGAAP
jgi:23S rRNA (guanine2445-N2)-methyltransferase / 23S rRNA (guanine2069-N7)-methyltransferase